MAVCIGYLNVVALVLVDNIFIVMLPYGCRYRPTFDYWYNNCDVLARIHCDIFDSAQVNS